jgi:multidrug transporter EmrE-like cation transporter
MVNVLLVAFGIVLNVAAQVALKIASAPCAGASVGSAVAMLPRIFLSAPALIGIGLYGLSVLNWAIVLSRMELSVAYPLMSLGYVFAFAVGCWWFGEPVNAVRLVGVAVILVGIVLITRPVVAHV